MKRILLLTFAIAAVSGAQAVPIFSDGFESGDFSNWTGTVSPSEPEKPFIQNSVVHTGNFAASVPGANTGGVATVLDRQYVSFAPIAATDDINLTFWMKLDAASGNHRHYMELRSYANDVFGGSLDQIIAVGAFNSTTNSIDGNGVVTTSTNTSKWQVRVGLSGYANNGWFVLDQAANRTTDWTRFELKVTTSGINVYVDGVLGNASAYNRGNSTTWTADSLVMGSGLTSASINANFDDINLEAVPEPATMVALGFGAAALMRKRSKK
ncbi:MAG: PEP-CTERM sorting domain-containing protein [Fimbriimonadaceae bacterium]|nr:MAG: PEP-CTERM sorting domain-containing protein [Fimbriimonadaceae bacterium]